MKNVFIFFNNQKVVNILRQTIKGWCAIKTNSLK